MKAISLSVWRDILANKRPGRPIEGYLYVQDAESGRTLVYSLDHATMPKNLNDELPPERPPPKKRPYNQAYYLTRKARMAAGAEQPIKPPPGSPSPRLEYFRQYHADHKARNNAYARQRYQMRKAEKAPDA